MSRIHCAPSWFQWVVVSLALVGCTRKRVAATAATAAPEAEGDKPRLSYDEGGGLFDHVGPIMGDPTRQHHTY